MPVTLPSGIALEDTTRSMSSARAAICSGVSSTTPAGAVENPGCVGLSEWQAAQRSSTIGATSEYETVALPVPAGPVVRTDRNGENHEHDDADGRDRPDRPPLVAQVEEDA